MAPETPAANCSARMASLQALCNLGQKKLILQKRAINSSQTHVLTAKPTSAAATATTSHYYSKDESCEGKRCLKTIFPMLFRNNGMAVEHTKGRTKGMKGTKFEFKIASAIIDNIRVMLDHNGKGFLNDVCGKPVCKTGQDWQLEPRSSTFRNMGHIVDIQCL